MNSKKKEKDVKSSEVKETKVRRRRFTFFCCSCKNEESIQDEVSKRHQTNKKASRKMGQRPIAGMKGTTISEDSMMNTSKSNTHNMNEESKLQDDPDGFEFISSNDHQKEQDQLKDDNIASFIQQGKICQKCSQKLQVICYHDCGDEPAKLVTEELGPQ